MGREGSHEPLLVDHRIQVTEGKLHVSDDLIIPFIEGDSIGPDMWAARVGALDAAVEKAFGGRKRIMPTKMLRRPQFAGAIIQDMG